MPLITPILDDRRFEDLFLELRNRIPVYNPQWTDHQESDPGITLLQLFAYLGEGLQFRFNQIPEATKLAFLHLLDVPLYGARAATTLVRASSEVAHGVAVYAGDQLKAGKTIFTVTQDVTVWPLDCVAVARHRLVNESQPDEVSAFLAQLDPELKTAVQGSIDALKTHHDAQSKALEAVAPYEIVTLASDGASDPIDFADTVDGCVWIAVLKNPKVTPDPAKDLLNVAGRPLSLSVGFSPAAWFPDIEQAPACSGDVGPSLWWQATVHTPGRDGGPDYTPVRVSGDTTQGFTRQGVVRLELPADLSGLGVPEAPPSLAGTGDYPPELDDDRADQVWFWLRVWRGDGSRIGQVQLITLNALPVEQSVRAAPELLGSGAGQPDQVFQLAHAPVLSDARQGVRLQVEEGGVWTDWTQVDTLDASTHDDRHFTLDAEAGTVRFGERFPQLGERIRVNEYRWGGGSQGNVPPASITKWGDVLTSPVPAAPLKRPTQVTLVCTNPLAAQGGVDSESLDAALQRVPAELRRNRRAVTRDDFAELALQTPTVSLGRAECLPLFHAPSQSAKPGNVSVVVWPARDAQHPEAPRPDAYELGQVCAWLDQWRLVTTELHVIPPTYQRVALALSVQVKDGYGLDAVRDWLDMLLRQYLSPMPPYGPEGRGWPLGRRLLARELEGVAMQVEGVSWIEALRLDREVPGQNGAPSTWVSVDLLTLPEWVVPELAGITVVDAATPLPAPGQAITPPPMTPPVPVPVLRDDC
ncbi:MAG TPA: putative baseplate assembly protein [Aquabacterium sp.]|uniref:putative baseplate assembly protein n=1 Tax=Aquabacterium sp. TaxID=1872578 RepID=UPI002E3617DA|nr:putative baseplate assembly protein [Aquabacterium sp.]HEX5373062.1 putative baseplate assembly protein [Aquabacterium sp.]